MMKSWYKRIRNWIGGDTEAPTNDDGPVVPARTLVGGALNTLPNELDCNECFEQLDHFVEMSVSGKNAPELMPLVQDHLDRCPDCREEYEALLLALHANA